MIVTLASQSSPGALDNEDAAAATPRAAVVVDGATVPEGVDTGCRHTTAWYARRLTSEILAALADEPDGPLPAALAAAIGTVADAHSSTCDLGHPGTPAAAVAVLRERAASVDYLVLSDVTVVFDSGDNVLVISDDRIVKIPQEKYTPGRPPTEWRYRNRPGGYWVAAATPRAADEALCGSVRPDAIRRAIAVTDGAARLSAQFAVIPWRVLLRIIEEDGPGEVLRRTREVELQDPNAQRWPRSKCHDDATVAYCRFPSRIEGTASNVNLPASLQTARSGGT